MTILGAVNVLVKADTRDFVRDMNKSQKTTMSFIKQGIKPLGVAFSALTAAAGGAAVVFREALQEAQNTIEMQRFADRLGVSTNRLMKYQKAAKLVGVTQEQFNDGLLEFSKRSAEATTGTGSLHDALEILNINVRDFASMDAITQFETFAKATEGMSKNMQNFLSDEMMGGAADDISGFESAIVKAAAGMENFNTQVELDQNRDFIKQWTAFASKFAEVKRDFVLDVTPALTDALKIIGDLLPYLAAARKVNFQLAEKLFSPGQSAEGMGPIDRRALMMQSNNGRPLTPSQTASLTEEAAANAAALNRIAASSEQTADALTNPASSL